MNLGFFRFFRARFMVIPVKTVLLITLLLLVRTPARPDSVPISAYADFANAVTAYFHITGPGIELASSTVDWTGPVLFECYNTCNATQSLPAALNFEPSQLAVYGSGGTFDGISANALGGSLTFTAGDLVGPESDMGGTVDLPVTVSGEVTGYEFTGCPGDCGFGTPLWVVNITGTGVGEFFFPQPGVVADVVYTFSGFAGPAGDNTGPPPAETPEPASLILMGSGLLGLVIWRRAWNATRGSRAARAL